jgi:hypothetical protein
MGSEGTLLGLQRRFMAALTEPIYGDSRERSQLPPRPGDVSEAFAETATTLITPSPTLQPVERLELYHRQYWYRLLDSLAEDFPALKALLGKEAFWHLIEAYLESAPPSSFTLRHLGSGLADFVRKCPARTAHPVHAYAAAALAVVMATALATAHADKAFASLTAFTKQAPFPFLVAALVVLAFGAGLFSVDGWLRARSGSDRAGQDEESG